MASANTRKDPRDAGKDSKPQAAKAPPAMTHNPNAPADAQASAQPPEGDAPRARKKIEPELVSVTVHTAFTLTPDSGSPVRYHQGVQDIPREHAEHYYAKHHLDVNEK